MTTGNKILRASALTLVLATAMATATTTAARAEYPTRSISIVIPFGAGGITDLVARRVSDRLGDELGANIVIENRPGAGGTVAARYVAEANPDGYTLFVETVGSQVVNPMIRDNVGYDPVESFEPIGLIAGTPFLLAVNAGMGVSSYEEFVSYARERPGELNFGSAGIASSPHLGLELLRTQADLEIEHIPFGSGREAVNAAASGEVDVTIDAAIVIMPLVEEGTLTALMIAGDRPLTAAEGVPTNVEAGAEGISITSWSALYAPAETPDEIVTQLNEALVTALSDPDLISGMESQGTLLFTGALDEYETFVAEERERWGTVVREADIRLD